MKLFLGVDGGQSSTVALVADETGKVLGAGRGGACNHVAAAEGRVRFSRAIHECLAGACSQAGLDPGTVSFESAWLGFSGGVSDKDAYSREFIRSRRFGFSTDAEIALTGATVGESGIIVIAGTGSIAFGRNRTGDSARAGGWGHIFGDEGGAFDIVRQTLRAALAMEEGWGPQTGLRQKLLSAAGASSADELMHSWYNAFDRTQIAQLSQLVDEVASAGDEVAAGILETAGGQLASLVGSVYKKLFAGKEQPVVAYVGGVFRSELLTLALKRAVHSLMGRDAIPPQLPPAAGALIEAFKAVGLTADISAIPTIKN